MYEYDMSLFDSKGNREDKEEEKETKRKRRMRTKSEKKERGNEQRRNRSKSERLARDGMSEMFHKSTMAPFSYSAS